MKEGKRRITVEVDQPVHLAVKIHCARLGIPMTEWLAQIIVEHIKELESSEQGLQE